MTKSENNLQLILKKAAFYRLPFVLLLIRKLFRKHRYAIAFFLFGKSRIDDAIALYKSKSGLKFKHENEKLLFERLTAIEMGAKSSPLKSRSSDIKKGGKRILMALHNSAPYDYAGYWFRTIGTLDALKKQGYEIECCTRPGYPWDLIKHRDKPKRYSEKVEGFNFTRLVDKNKTFKKGSDQRYIDTYVNELVLKAKQNNSQIIHAHSNFLNGLAAAKAAKSLGIRSVYEVRGLWHLTQASKNNSYEHTIMFDYEWNKELEAMHEADRVVVLSDTMRELIVSKGVPNGKITTIPNAVANDVFKYGEGNNTVQIHKVFHIGFIGTITHYEGLELVIDAVKLLVKQNNLVELTIVGDGVHLESLKQYSKNLKYVRFIGRIPKEQVAKYYQQFDVCIYPRTNHLVCNYIPPMKIVEAMGYGCPVIVSDLLVMREYVNHNETGLICSLKEKDSLALNILKIMEDPKLKAKLSKNALNWVKENHNWDIVSRKYSNVFND